MSHFTKTHSDLNFRKEVHTPSVPIYKSLRGFSDQVKSEKSTSIPPTKLNLPLASLPPPRDASLPRGSPRLDRSDAGVSDLLLLISSLPQHQRSASPRWEAHQVQTCSPRWEPRQPLDQAPRPGSTGHLLLIASSS